ncbi:MAG: M48 family metalloprotease, partial [Bdellovibrionia bacterium]
MSNLTRIWILLSLLSFSILIAGFEFGERRGLLIAFGLVLLLNTGTYLLADFRVRHLFAGKVMLGQDPWGLGEMVSEFSRKTRIPRPEVIVVPLKVPTALSTGRHWRSATIFVSEGLLKTLNQQELRAVIAHEISKIKRLDTFAQSVSSSLSGALSWLARRLDSVFSRRSHRFEKAFEPIALLPVHFSVGRSSYFKADELASHLIGGPHVLAQVLWKLHSYAGTEPLEIPRSTAHLFIV